MSWQPVKLKRAQSKKKNKKVIDRRRKEETGNG